MTEKRLFPRIECRFPVYDHAFNIIGNAIDISLGGIQVESFSYANDDVNKEILFFLEGQKELIKTKVSTIRKNNFDAERSIAAYSFLEFSPGADDLISNYVISSIWNKIFAPLNKNGKTQDQFFSKIDRQEEIENILLEACKSKATFFCFQNEGKNVLQCTLQKTEHDKLLFKAEKHFDVSQIINENEIYLNVTIGYSNYILFSEKHSTKNQELTISAPEILYACARRAEKRENVSNQNITIYIPLPYPSGATLCRKVIDLSNNGLAFHNPIDEFYFLPGTPIENLKVLAENKEFVTRGEIRHITPISGNGNGNEAYLKVGIFFPDKKVGFMTGDTKSLPTSSRLSKTGKSFFKDIIHCMKGLAAQSIYLAQKGIGSRSLNYKKTSLVDIIRIKNKKNEDVVGIINKSWDGNEKKNAHVLIIPPAFGKRKESTGPLALALIENFKRVGIDLVIIRYDGIRNFGESYKEASYRQPGREAIAMTISQACDDLKTVVSFTKNNDRFICEKLVLLTFSIGALPARRLLAQNELGKVDLWIAGMGMPCVRESLRNASGGIDYIENHEKKIYHGEITILGVNIDSNNFCQDILDNSMAYLEDSIADMEKISTPVHWILGEDDAWIEPSQVRRLLDAHKTGKAFLHSLKMGHVPMTGLESLKLFRIIINTLFKAFLKKDVTPIFPLPHQLDDLRVREWDRTTKYPLTNPEKYWSGYLLGQKGKEDAYDVLWMCKDYVKFLQDERNALDIKQGCNLVDMGCGTGNFGQLLITDYVNNGGFLPELTVVDLVPDALDKVKGKYTTLLGDLSNKNFTFKQFDLEINRLIPVKQFLEGDFYSLDKFKCKINGLYDDTIELWKEHYSELLHQILRGKILNAKDNNFLKETFATEEIGFIKDMNIAARFLKGLLTDDDLCDGYNARTKDIDASKLKFNALDFGNSSLDFKIPFEDNKFDRILSSLVLSYLKNPDVTFSEFVRCLKPGGRIVISTMKPDTDMSIIFTNLIKKIEQSNEYSKHKKDDILESIRAQANRVAFLLTLVEECQFRFFSKEEILGFAEENNLKDVTITESYGTPSQAFILSGVK